MHPPDEFFLIIESTNLVPPFSPTAEVELDLKEDTDV
jgi:hypothetical protein